MDRVRPSLVVVDVSVEVSLLVRLAGSPLVVVALPGRRQDRAHRTAYDAAETLLAPWPEQTHATDWPVEWRKKVRCVGGISQFDGRAAPDARRRPGQVLLLWGGGGHGTTRGEIEAAQRATRGWTWLERSPDRPSADLWRELHESDVVVTHGGQNAVADVAASRTPAVVVAQDRPFDEQGATARAVDRLGAAVGVERWPSSGEWPDLLERARAQGGSGWSRWSTGHGADAAARVLDTMAAEPWRAQDIE